MTQKSINPEMTDVSLDIESGGTVAGYAVVNIGAVYFNRKAGTFGETLDISLDVDDLKSKGYKLDVRTMAWWEDQSDAVREHCWAGIVPVREALFRLTGFLAEARLKDMQLWVKGEHMDIAMLEFMFDQEQMPTPWHFRLPRDLRTYEQAIVDAGCLCRMDPPINPAPHTGLGDAVTQAHRVIAHYDALQGRKNDK